ncbi:MAG: hypothetical protein WKG32_14035 [Gemmatimonadaceae bacterium]
MVFELIGLGAAAGAAITGYLNSRSFVRRKLRFVDAAQTPVAPLIAGLAAAVVAVPVVALLPIVGAGTALIFGASVGTGVAHGARDARRLNG